MTAAEMWARYTQKNTQARAYEAWAFCGGGAIGDDLADLVLAGTKTATASLLLAYETENEPLPEVGCYSVVLRDDGEAVCVIRDTRVTTVPFDEVSERHAYLEGEDDRSLAYWRRVHRDFFTEDFDAAQRPFDEHSLCVLEEFEVVYRPEETI